MFKLARYVAFTVLMVSSALLVAACQQAPAPAPAPTQAPAKAAPTTAPAGTVGVVAAPTAAPGTELDPNQEFRVNLGGEPENIDPNKAAWDSSIAVITQVFSGLLKFDKNLNVIADIAQDIPSTANGGISADGKTYTFKLRSGVKYSDGKAVSAKDIEYSTKRLLDPATAADYASFYYVIQGAEEYNSSKEKDSAKLQALRDAVGVKALDEQTVQFKLKNSQASFLQLAAMWPVFPLREDIIKANSTADKPEKWTEDPKSYIGNGPFKMTEWVHQDHITLVPNENYFGTKPKLKKITLYMVTDVQANYAAFLNGEREVTAVPVALVDQIQKDANLSKQLLRNPRLATFGYQFNLREEPLKSNVKLRQALAMAIDRQAFVEKVRKGVGKPALSWIPPGMPGHQADLGKDLSFNATKAKQLLAEAGYPDGKGLPKITFTYANTGNNPLYAQFAQEQFKTNLGVELTLDPMEPKAASQAINKGQFTIAFFGWGADYPDPDNWLPEIFGTGAGNNRQGYSNTKLDDLMKQAKAETDPKKRLDMWNQAQKMVVDDAVMVFLVHDETFVLVKPYVKDIFFNGMDFSSMPGGRSYFQAYLTKKQ